jgi:peptide/nickel transport system substrate-binding protein
MNGKRSLLLTAVLSILLWLPAHSNAAPANRLLIAMGQEPTTMDPSACYVGSADYQVSLNYAERLLSMSTSGQLKPGLATSWKMSSDGKVIDFTLRKGVKFHSGDALTAKDVQFSFEWGLAIKNRAVMTRLALMEKFVIVDDYTFKIYFKAPDLTFLPNMTGPLIVSKSYFDRVGKDKFAKEPVGTGPYKFVRYVQGEYVDIERFDGYWGEKPSVQAARFYFVPEDTTRAAKLRAGEVDFITTCPYPLVKDFEKSSGFKIVKLALGHPTVSVAFSPQNPNVPWHDKRVRLAMAYAIDWKSILDNVLMGIPNHYAYLAPYEPGYDPDLKPYPYDPKKAKELLSQAGYPNGFEFKLNYPITGRVPMVEAVSEAIASYFEAVGIKTRLQGQEWDTYQTAYQKARSPESVWVSLHTHGRAGSAEPVGTMQGHFTQKGTYSLYTHPELEKLVAEAISTVDDAKRAEVVKKATRLIHEEVASIPIFNNVSVYVMKKIVDFTPTLGITQDLIYVKDIKITN